LCAYRTKPLTVAWRTILLPARCFTSTVSLGWHHLTSREPLNAAQDVARRSSSEKKFGYRHHLQSGSSTRLDAPREFVAGGLWRRDGADQTQRPCSPRKFPGDCAIELAENFCLLGRGVPRGSVRRWPASNSAPEMLQHNFADG
jgi:hypothetical protein